MNIILYDELFVINFLGKISLMEGVTENIKENKELNNTPKKL